jgi:hypothetical protein
MNAPVALWRRSQFQAGGTPNTFQLFAFSPGALQGDVPLSAARFGLPSPEAMQQVEIRELPRSVDPAWFDGFRSGSLRTLAQQALGGTEALDAATQLVAVLISRPDTDDLQHLQAGWAVAKWLVARGATVLLDAQCNRFWKAEEVADWPAIRPFTLSSDVNVIVEAEPTSPTAIIHTRGMQKVGRADLVVLDVPGAQWDAVAGLVRACALQAADGVVYKAGQQVTVDKKTITFAEYEPTQGTELHLNNHGLLLTIA